MSSSYTRRTRWSQVDGKVVPDVPKAELARLTPGYQYLPHAQETLGHKIMNDLPNIQNEASFEMYKDIAAWLQGEDIDVFGEERDSAKAYCECVRS